MAGWRLIILACSAAMLVPCCTAGAAILPSRVNVSPMALGPGQMSDSTKISWLWSYLNRWTSHLSVDSDSDYAFQGVIGPAQAVPPGLTGCAEHCFDNFGENWRSFLKNGLFFLTTISGSTHSAASSSGPPP